MITINRHAPGFLPTASAIILILGMALVTHFFKSLFVYETGNITAFGMLGLLLSIGLLYRWRFVREITAGFSLLVFLLLLQSTFITPWNDKSGSILLLGVAYLLVALLLFSKGAKRYQQGVG